MHRNPPGLPRTIIDPANLAAADHAATSSRPGSFFRNPESPGESNITALSSGPKTSPHNRQTQVLSPPFQGGLGGPLVLESEFGFASDACDPPTLPISVKRPRSSNQSGDLIDPILLKGRGLYCSNFSRHIDAQPQPHCDPDQQQRQSSATTAAESPLSTRSPWHRASAEQLAAIPS